MNFFEHQDMARRNTTYLIGMFGFAIAAMIFAFYFVALILFGDSGGSGSLWRPDIMLLVTAAVLVTIGFGSFTKMVQLQGGGSAVANSLGGRLLNIQTDNADELRLLNVVAEMALAAGTPIPAVYLLEHESGINAFAAGHSPDDAVIGVTRGCLEQLSRDELQGVIGHEFSHILNGDMSLNLKLIGVLQGLLLIYIMGRSLLRGSAWSGSSRDNKGRGSMLALGLAMVVIGGIGLLCGRLIKSAVSRQREFLADASAVQFTRNIDGIAGALRRIGGLTSGSRVASPHAEEASHMFFGEALPGLAFLGSAFATHPPLKERIRRLQGVNVDDIANLPTATATPPAPAEMVMGFQAAAIANTTPTSAPATPPRSPSPDQFLAAVGTLDASHLAQAQDFLKELPREIVTAIRQVTSATYLIYAILLDKDEAMRSQQLALLGSAASPETATQVAQLWEQLSSINSGEYLSLLDLAVPSLRTLSQEQCSQFFKHINALIRADGQLSISEYVLQLILQKRLRPYFQQVKEPPKAITTIDPVWNDALVVLSLLARLGHKAPDDATYAFKSGLYRLPGAKKRELPPLPPEVRLQDLGPSLKRIELAIPKLKQSIVDACAHTVLMDNDVTPREAELLRAIVITLDCPIPPFLKAIRYNQ
jgi:Zn-dependent protease with chaperone function